MAKMFFVYPEQLKVFQRLMDKKEDGTYFVLRNEGGFCDIVQYCKYYDNLRIVCVQEGGLDVKMRVG